MAGWVADVNHQMSNHDRRPEGELRDRETQKDARDAHVSHHSHMYTLDRRSLDEKWESDGQAERMMRDVVTGKGLEDTVCCPR